VVTDRAIVVARSPWWTALLVTSGFRANIEYIATELHRSGAAAWTAFSRGT
jgi:hypothetical protein